MKLALQLTLVLAQLDLRCQPGSPVSQFQWPASDHQFPAMDVLLLTLSRIMLDVLVGYVISDNLVETNCVLLLCCPVLCFLDQ